MKKELDRSSLGVEWRLRRRIRPVLGKTMASGAPVEEEENRLRGEPPWSLERADAGVQGRSPVWLVRRGRRSGGLARCSIAVLGLTKEEKMMDGGEE